MAKRALLMVLVTMALLGGLMTQPLAAQDAPITFDEAWLNSVVAESNPMEQLMNAWMTRVGDVWRSERTSAGTYDIPGNSVVFGSPMNAGNDPAFEQLAPEIYFTGEGGRFGATEAFRAFQLDGAYHGSGADRPNNIDAIIALALAQPDYDQMIMALDVEWTGSPNPINRWGSSGPWELLTDEQEAALVAANLPLQPVVQLLPGNTIVWGELSDEGLHWGLVRIAENVYATTCQGGEFRTFRGFRAMQFSPAAVDAIIPDLDGCNPEGRTDMATYPVLDPNVTPASAVPLTNAG